MATDLVHTDTVPPSSDEIRSQLDRLLASSTFSSADRLSRFLRYVVERTLAGEGDRLKEYVIGVEVFDRDEQYDPRLDSIVRVEAGRLRAKVDEYYRGDGLADGLIIRMRRGSYVPVFEEREAPPSPSPAPDVSIAQPAGKRNRWRLALGIVVAGLLLVAIAAWRSGLWATDAPPAPAVTIAVLPFAHYSSDKADQLLAARVTDGVTSELARNGTLGVVSRTSALQFANGGRLLQDVAQALNADVVIEGSLVREGDRVLVEARLVHGKRDRKFWVREFAGTMAEIPELQRRIATAAAAAATGNQAGPGHPSAAAAPGTPAPRRGGR
jgi:TolB-like protein